MRVFITGGTGLIGRHLVRALVARGDRPVVLTRQADKARHHPALGGAEVIAGDPTAAGPWQSALDGCDAVVNLAGHNVFAARWTAAVKRAIRDSRVRTTEHVVAALARATRAPGVLVQGSAIGYYGPRGDEELTESGPPGADFLAVVCRQWEDAARPAAERGTRLAVLRIGIVLDRDEGALALMTPLFKYGPGAPIGSGPNPLRPAAGKQWMSWIHRDDIVGLILLALDRNDARGPINGTAPHPVRNADFARALSDALRGPLTPWRRFLPIGPPDVVLRLLLGEVAHVIATGQRVVPDRARALGYRFQFPELAPALADLLGTKAGDADRAGSVEPL